MEKDKTPNQASSIKVILSLGENLLDKRRAIYTDNYTDRQTKWDTKQICYLVRILLELKHWSSIREAADSLGFAQSGVHRTIVLFRETAEFRRKRGSGRKRCTNARDNRYIMMLSLRNRHMTAVEIRNRLHRVREVNVSERTVRRRLNE
ncbi:hypothetical protein BDFB_015053, partial [Asbolus verrucosus]